MVDKRVFAFLDPRSSAPRSPKFLLLQFQGIGWYDQNEV